MTLPLRFFMLVLCLGSIIGEDVPAVMKDIPSFLNQRYVHMGVHDPATRTYVHADPGKTIFFSVNALHVGPKEARVKSIIDRVEISNDDKGYTLVTLTSEKKVYFITFWRGEAVIFSYVEDDKQSPRELYFTESYYKSLMNAGDQGQKEMGDLCAEIGKFTAVDK